VQRGPHPGLGGRQSGSGLVDPQPTLHVQRGQLFSGDRWRWDAVDPSRLAKSDPVLGLPESITTLAGGILVLTLFTAALIIDLRPPRP
jgi:hypothetical protein